MSHLCYYLAKVIKEANNVMISHDDYFNCSSILSLLTVLLSLYSFSLRSLITPVIILSEEHRTSLICCHEFTTHHFFSWWMASKWEAGSSEGITNVAEFNHVQKSNWNQIASAHCISIHIGLRVEKGMLTGSDGGGCWWLFVSKRTFSQLHPSQ